MSLVFEIRDMRKKVRCGACGGKVGRVNMVMLDRLATWKYPTAGNVLTGESGRAVAVLCDACADAAVDVKIREAVEFVGKGAPPLYHPIETLEKLPDEGEGAS